MTIEDHTTFSLIEIFVYGRHSSNYVSLFSYLNMKIVQNSRPETFYHFKNKTRFYHHKDKYLLRYKNKENVYR